MVLSLKGKEGAVRAFEEACPKIRLSLRWDGGGGLGESPDQVYASRAGKGGTKVLLFESRSARALALDPEQAYR